MLISIHEMRVCMAELAKCSIDMTNVAITHLCIALGAIAGSMISWLIFALHIKPSSKQEENLKQLNEFDETHDKI
jgi:hypothetical protein